MKDSTFLTDFVNEYKNRIELTIEKEVLKDVSQSDLSESMLYSLKAGGKRLRPLLTLAVLKTFNHNIDEDELKVSSALELLHTYSLIHDDLPAMDNDDLRRGKATNHVVYGEGLATLAGDALLTLSFQWLTDNNLSDAKKVQLVLELSKKAGPSGMVAGQAIDILNENKPLTLDQIKHLHEQKTGDLIRYALIAGGIMSDCESEVIKLLDNFGADYGLAFQIYDDILDVTSNTEDLGKPVHQDSVKNTYTNQLGLDKAYEYLEDTLDHSKMILNKISDLNGIDVSLLMSFLDYFNIEK
ncbi:MAG: polyprenyl synthetase family protein [Apilactobacillus sp.]|uniref:polyprenyl synthetase family protein n=1 Tax=Apilactobacillus TaxID=2767877 RepID=UPI0025E90907|nr:farnesyl diphosphate synthase [Apilactobacillus sp.]MCT6822362.1 polyprenyl synthetase family protein [Apilactobacillus sp.]MCT6857704.1 polyprenyl synthetase family protein [Apilactobacillus sp.]